MVVRYSGIMFARALTIKICRNMPGAEMDKRGIPLHSPMEKMPPMAIFYPVFNGVMAGLG